MQTVKPDFNEQTADPFYNGKLLNLYTSGICLPNTRRSYHPRNVKLL